MTKSAKYVSFVVAGGLAACASVPVVTAPPATVPVLVSISGFGKWGHSPPNPKETFGFATRPAAQVCPAQPPPACPAAYPDTAFIDFSIPVLTTFEVSSGGTVLSEVPETAPLGDFQYRKAVLTDGSGSTITYRIAVSVPAAHRTWCPTTLFPLDIIDISTNSQGQTRSSPLSVRLVWGKCVNAAASSWFAVTSSNGPPASSPPAPAPDCPNGGVSQPFNVCESCGTGSVGIEKTLWGCDLNEAEQNMGLPGCVYALRSGIGC